MAGSEISHLPIGAHKNYAIGDKALESQENDAPVTGMLKTTARSLPNSAPIFDTIPTGLNSLSQRKSLADIYSPSNKATLAFTKELIPSLGDASEIQKAIERINESSPNSIGTKGSSLHASKNEDEAIQCKTITSLLECVEAHTKTLSEIYAKMQGVAKG